MRVALRDLEAQAKMEKAAIADLEARGSAAVRLPSIEETVERAMLFEKNLLENPTAGREALRHLFEDGKVLCRPQPDGVYLAEGKCPTRWRSSPCASQQTHRRPATSRGQRTFMARPGG